MKKTKIYIGADHRGYKLKEKISRWLFEKKYDFEDMGAESLDKSDDYTEYAEKVASMVADNKHSKGILICGSGVGVDVVANKFDGIRASVGKSSGQVKKGREDDDMNILVIASDFTHEKESLEMVETFLSSKFLGLARHKRRLQEISKIEANN